MSLHLKFLEIMVIAISTVVAANNISPVTIRRNDHGTCLSQNERQEAFQIINTIINLTLQNTNLNLVLGCGPGEWYKVAQLNMSDPSQQCPSAWREYNTSGVRVCGKTASGCSAVFYFASHQYSRVCGRAIGYQVGSPDAFGLNTQGQTIDSTYVYGVSITHGSPRNHIWTYAAGTTEGRAIGTRSNCPCAGPPSNRAPPPSFIGDNYYCESGNAEISYQSSYLYNSDPLWDGEQCEGQCCSNGKSPPWFSVELPNPTTDDIEVRICGPEGTYDDTPVQQLKLYIQ